MKDKTMRIVFSSCISDLMEQNSSFDRGVLRVAYTGRNRNNSFISKETFERCIASIYNCPIVCRYDRETDSIGAHDIDIVKDDDGGVKIVNATHPVGVIPENASYWWEEVEDASGVHEYLCVDALLWKRQEAYQKIKENGITDESMEISVKDGKMVNGVFVITQFEFTAFCLLGSAEPCFESASLEVFSMSDFKQQFSEMMRDLKESFSLDQHPHGVEIYTKNNLEGGDDVLTEKEQLMAEYGLDIDSLDFSIEDFSLEELREKFEKMKSANDAGVEADGVETDVFALEGQFRDELFGALDQETAEVPWGTDSRYWFWDYDRELSEVYATDITDWNIYGFPYSMDGDHVVIDFKCKKRMKLCLEPFDEGSSASMLGNMFAKVSDGFVESNAELQRQFDTASESIASMKAELDELRQFKQNADNTVERFKRDEILSQFEDLSGIEAFEDLRHDCMSYTVEELEEKCYAVRGRSGAAQKFSLEQKTPKLPVEKSNPGNEPYGGLFAEYGFSI